jgi:glycosyltransferase involved in cell wall biosynthesis
VNLRRNRRLQTKLRRQRIDVLACSEADRDYLGGGPQVIVFPNGYERQGPPVGRAVPARVPTILIQGTMRYTPNIDAVRYFAREILPQIRNLRGETKFVVAGAIDDDVRNELAQFHGVAVLGFVPRIEDALARADLVVAPLRLGGGTRVKILEAFSHRIPVVSTSIGAEGLDVASGRELLIADEPDEFARACVRLLEGNEQRARLIDHAYDLVERKYSWPTIRSDFETVLRSHAAIPDTGSGRPF